METAIGFPQQPRALREPGMGTPARPMSPSTTTTAKVWVRTPRDGGAQGPVFRLPTPCTLASPSPWVAQSLDLRLQLILPDLIMLM